METKSLSELKLNPKNPRSLSRSDAEVLAKSLVKYGDLSGFVLNVRTGLLVAGHMRSQTFDSLPGDKQIIITERYTQPNSVGTVAIGYLLYNGERYGYREVDFDEATATAAGIAANHIHGQDDNQLYWIQEFGQGKGQK